MKAALFAVGCMPLLGGAESLDVNFFMKLMAHPMLRIRISFKPFELIVHSIALAPHIWRFEELIAVR
jgi:hypothetical protein